MLNSDLTFAFSAIDLPSSTLSESDKVLEKFTVVSKDMSLEFVVNKKFFKKMILESLNLIVFEGMARDCVSIEGCHCYFGFHLTKNSKSLVIGIYESFSDFESEKAIVSYEKSILQTCRLFSAL